MPRLLHFHGDKVSFVNCCIWQTIDCLLFQNGVEVRERPRCKTSIDETDVFIFDNGADLILVSKEQSDWSIYT